jgi:serine/threonine protein kinase
MLHTRDDDEKIRHVVVGEACLGSGAFGSVYLGFDGATGKTVAVKEIPISPDEAGGGLPMNIINEIAIMRDARHPNLVEYHGSRLTETAHGGTVVQIVMEFVASGSLAGLLRRAGTLREPVAAMYMRDVLCGLEYLHRSGVCHRDIKSENILVSPEGRCKITDYGASKVLRSSIAGVSTMLNTFVGTPFYVAPEVVRGESYGRSADIWSVGCLAYELLTGAPPNYGVVNPMAAMYKVASDGDAVPVLPDGHSTDAADFVATCCRRDAARRPTAAALLDHPWVRKLVSTGTATSAPRDRTPKNTAASALNSKPRESFAGSQGVNEDDDGVSLSRCHACGEELALFSCDDCRRLNLAHSLCHSCWGTSHRTSRSRGHVKRPLLFLPPRASPQRHREPPRRFELCADGGMMLPGGAFVDTINDADDVEWECGRCHLLNTMTAAECLCGHLR